MEGVVVKLNDLEQITREAIENGGEWCRTVLPDGDIGTLVPSPNVMLKLIEVVRVLEWYLDSKSYERDERVLYDALDELEQT